jgi:hypothetical protein
VNGSSVGTHLSLCRAASAPSPPTPSALGRASLAAEWNNGSYIERQVHGSNAQRNACCLLFTSSVGELVPSTIWLPRCYGFFFCIYCSLLLLLLLLECFSASRDPKNRPSQLLRCHVKLFLG